MPAPSAAIEIDQQKETDRKIDKIYQKGSMVLDFTTSLEENYENAARSLDQFYLRFFEHASTIDDYYKSQVTTFTDKLRDTQAFLLGADGFQAAQSARTQLLNHAMKIVHEALNAQICAVFLMNKQGSLSRQGFYGLDRNGSEIDPEWYKEEEYDLNSKSFVGKAAITSSAQRPPFGNIQHAVNFEANEANSLGHTSIERYHEKCDSLDRVIAFPINCRSGILGVLRILNTIDPVSGRITKGDEKHTNDRDIMLMSFFASHISNALLSLDQSLNRRLLSFITKKTVEARPDHPDWSAKQLLEETSKIIVQNESLPFVFSIIRTISPDGKLLEEQAKAFCDYHYNETVLGERQENAIPLTSKEAFVSIACNTKTPVIISNITERLTQFKNIDWVRSLELATFCCFPLLCKDEPLGTLSLYTRRKFTYDAKSVEYLQTVADALALHLYINKKSSKSVSGASTHPAMHQSRQRSNSLLHQ
jgi:GAF domain-containing protein